MQKCNGCTPKHSEEWSLSAELAKSNRRMFISLIVVIVLWFATIFGFVWYLNQFDFSSDSLYLDGQDGGNANYIGNDGDIYNGESDCCNQ